MTKQVYVTGYSGKSPDDLLSMITKVGGTIFDIRFSARSRNPQWALSNLQSFFGDRYRHVKALGNRNYKGGDIELVNYELGRQLIDESPFTVILLCVCRQPNECHRSDVARRLIADGFTVIEYDDPYFSFTEPDAGFGQLSLFGE